MKRVESEAKAALTPIRGVLAILGMDIVSYSTFSMEDQLQAVQHLLLWIKQSLQFNNVGERDFLWSHGGDGGYVTFLTNKAGGFAIDVAFDIVRRSCSGDWSLRSGERIHLRMALHAGFVQEGAGLGAGRLREVSGSGINMAARVLSLSSKDQLLVSRDYFEGYIKGLREKDFMYGPLHSRTVKHGVKMEVMNVDHHGLCLNQSEAAAQQWKAIGNLWEQMASEYESLIHDSLKSGSVLAAIAAAKYLLRLRKSELVSAMARSVGSEHSTSAFSFPVPRHDLFSRLPASAILRIIEIAEPHVAAPGELICRLGEDSITCFFIVSGKVAIERPDNKETIHARLGELVGEFSLYMSGLKRTADLRSETSSLIIEIPIDGFLKILDSVKKSDIVFDRIRQRVLNNVIAAPDLFPGLEADGSDFPAACEKFSAGSTLDLEKQAYFIFNGTVEIRPANCPPKQVRAIGQATSETVVGIVSRVGRPDGKTAMVISETVAVCVSHDDLYSLQRGHPIVQRAWDALCGVRLGEIRSCGDPIPDVLP